LKVIFQRDLPHHARHPLTAAASLARRAFAEKVDRTSLIRKISIYNERQRFLL
jgi:hypothetical protein